MTTTTAFLTLQPSFPSILREPTRPPARSRPPTSVQTPNRPSQIANPALVRNTHSILPVVACSQSVQTPYDNLLRELYRLATSSGAMGRGIRACLHAFYRRAAFVVASARSKPIKPDKLYVEIGPAYVLATARIAMKRESVTRYAVEQRAWPALRNLFDWEETTSYDARARGALLRHLKDGGRFGRHVFLSYQALSCIMQVAEDLVETAQHIDYDTPTSDSSQDLTTPWAASEVEAIIELRRRPIPGIRTVSARCPRHAAHANGDRKPSLMLWMNADGITGGAMCPVCLDYDSVTHRSSDTSSPSPLRNVTWRVHYLPNNTAVLCTPQKRVRSPARIQQAMAECRLDNAPDERDATDQNASLSSPVDTTSQGKETAKERARVVADGPVGGCVLTDRKRIARVGEVVSMAYVTASLKIATSANTTEAIAFDSTRLRTVGTMARQRCPMQVLLGSDRRSRGPNSIRRVEEVAWFARQAAGLNDQDDVDDDKSADVDCTLESEEWLPTPLLSVSAMKPSGWRDVTSANGRLISVPASWEASVQDWVLFDIDDIENLTGENVVTEAANKIVLTVRRNAELSGRCLVIQTGPTGLHVWAKLREAREYPRLWFRKQETREWYADLGKRILQASHRAGVAGGKVDMSSCSAGRFARRPGWRLLEDGTLFRSHVVMNVPGCVRKRTPRL